MDDDTNPGNRPFEGASGGPQPPQYGQQPPQQPTQQWSVGPGSQNQWNPQAPYQQQPQQQWNPGPGPQQGWYPQDPYQQQSVYEEQRKSKGGLIAAITAILALILVAVLAWGYFQGGWFKSSDSVNGYSSATLTEEPNSSSADDSRSGGSGASESQERDDDQSDRNQRDGDRDNRQSREESRPENPRLPGNAVAVNEAARSGEPAGNFNNVYRGSDVTSKPFALAVRDTFVGEWLDTRDANMTIDVYSTVTKQTYSMTCRDNGRYVTCTGGNNAVVYIA